MLRQCCFATAEAERKGHVYCLNRCMEQQGLEIFNMTRTRVTLNRIHPNALRYYVRHGFMIWRAWHAIRCIKRGRVDLLRAVYGDDGRYVSGRTLEYAMRWSPCADVRDFLQYECKHQNSHLACQFAAAEVLARVAAQGRRRGERMWDTHLLQMVVHML